VGSRSPAAGARSTSRRRSPKVGTAGPSAEAGEERAQERGDAPRLRRAVAAGRRRVEGIEPLGAAGPQPEDGAAERRREPRELPERVDHEDLRRRVAPAAPEREERGRERLAGPRRSEDPPRVARLAPPVDEHRARIVEEEADEHPVRVGDRLLHEGEERRDPVGVEEVPVPRGSLLRPVPEGERPRGARRERRDPGTEPERGQRAGEVLAGPLGAGDGGPDAEEGESDAPERLLATGDPPADLPGRRGDPARLAAALDLLRSGLVRELRLRARRGAVEEPERRRARVRVDLELELGGPRRWQHPAEEPERDLGREVGDEQGGERAAALDPRRGALPLALAHGPPGAAARRKRRARKTVAAAGPTARSQAGPAIPK
jgi:hypothetical protein